MVCKHCGNLLREDAVVCDQCGAEVRPPQSGQGVSGRRQGKASAERPQRVGSAVLPESQPYRADAVVESRRRPRSEGASRTDNRRGTYASPATGSQMGRERRERKRPVRRMMINWALVWTVLLVLCFVGCCVLCLEFYAALAIGHSRPSHKMAWSVLFFFVLQFAMQMISSALIIGLDESAFYYFLMDLTDVHLSGTAAIHASLWFLSACAAIYGAVFYFLTTYFLKRHLNLE